MEGNPVFSMHGFDTIYYGSNLAEYFRNEFEGKHEIGPVRHVPFWSDIVERPEDAYAFYAATGKPEAALAAIQGGLRKKQLTAPFGTMHVSQKGRDGTINADGLPPDLMQNF